MRRRLLPVLLVLLAAAPAGARGLSSHVIDRVGSACVLVQVVQGETASTGSGFFVNRNDVVTNYHVVKPAVEGEAAIRLVVGGGTRSPELVDASLLAIDKDLDLALLRTDHRGRASLRFEPESRLRVTEPVWVFGFPFGARPGLEPTVTAGTISSLRHDEERRLRQVQVDAAVNQGNSGGPVVSALGRVVGVTQATINPKVGSGMALAVPSGAAEDFVEEGRRTRLRTGRLRIRGRERQPGFRIRRAEKCEEVWGTRVRFTVRGSRDAEEAQPLALEFLDRRRERVREALLDPGSLEPREEKVVEVRLRDVDFEDVESCQIGE